MTIEELISTEGDNIEFKLELPEKDIGFLKTVVAFSNGQGGIIVFGIRDEDHAVIGMSDETLFLDIDTITNIVVDNCEPVILPSVYPQTIEGKTVIVVQIPAGRQRPYYVKKLGMMKGTFIRISAETRLAPEYMIKELMFEGSGRFFDKTVCLELEATDQDIAKLCRSLKRTARANCLEEAEKRKVKDVTTAQLLSWGVLTQKDGKVMPTNAYALLTGHWRLPTMIQCALFKGTEKGIFLDKREYDGPIQKQQEEALQFVLRNIKLGARINGLYRQDIYEIPSAAIRELLINCALHRSYLAGGNIQVAIFDDRLEVFCPGKLPLDQTIELMRKGVSRIRNEALAKAFFYMNLIEGWGSGIHKINGALKEAGLKEMEITGGDVFLRFTIYRNLDFNPSENGTVNAESGHVNGESGHVNAENGTVNAENGTVNGESGHVNGESGHVNGESGHVNGDELSSKETIILLQLKRKNDLTIRQLSVSCKIAERTIRRYLLKLTEKGLIQRIGSDKTGHWEVVE